MMLPDVALHEIPEDLIPREPRLGGSCAPIPDSRLQALRSSGPAVLGRPVSCDHVRELSASVVAEIRSLFRVPEDCTCEIAAAGRSEMYRAVAAASRAASVEVTGQGPRSAAWRAAMTQAAGGASAGSVSTAPAGAGPPRLTATVAQEDRAWRERLARADPFTTWTVVDLSGQTGVVTDEFFVGTDIAFLCPGSLLGTDRGCMIVVMSPRAAARRTGAPRLSPIGTTDLVMLAHAVRKTAESDVVRLEARVTDRYELVSAWAAGLEWASCPPRSAGGDLVVRIRTTLGENAVERIGRFLELHHIAYGVTDTRCPGEFHIGLYPALAVADIERILNLLAFLARRSVAALGEVAR